MIRRPQPPSVACAGLTLLEVLASVAVITILATALLFSVGGLRSRAESAACTSNLRSLHASLAAYVSDKGHWPQQPEDLEREASDRWWIEELRPYHLVEKNWLCPTIKRLVAEQSEAGDGPLIHYACTNFDRGQLTPYKWKTQPWAVEIGDVHGNGPLTVLPDGSVQSFDDLWQQQTGQRPPVSIAPN